MVNLNKLKVKFIIIAPNSALDIYTFKLVGSTHVVSPAVNNWDNLYTMEPSDAVKEPLPIIFEPRLSDVFGLSWLSYGFHMFAVTAWAFLSFTTSLIKVS